MMNKRSLLLLLLLLLLSSSDGSPPVVLWHGMGDDCCSAGMNGLRDLIQRHTNASRVVSLSLSSSPTADRIDGFFLSAPLQVQRACTLLANLPPFHAVGLSQGGQFLRALVQTCSNVSVINLVTLGGQHQGVYGIPRCLAKESWICEEVRRLMEDVGVYTSFVQNHLAQANYWQDALDEARYLAKNIWLPTVNGYGSDVAQQKARLIKLNKFVMVKFLNDTMVQPRISSHFGWYKSGQDKVTVPLNETMLYAQDWLGLKQVDEAGKLVFLDSPGDHLQFTDEYFVKEIIPYLQ